MLARVGSLHSASRPPESGGESRNDDSGKRRNVKNFADLDDNEWKSAISGAVLLSLLCGFFAYFVVTGDDRKKENDKKRASTEPK